jgi:hypothetical protein
VIISEFHETKKEDQDVKSKSKMNLELCNKEFNKITGLDPQYFNEPRVWDMPIF